MYQWLCMWSRGLPSPFFGGGYNITPDNFFSSVALVHFLASKNLTYHGTVRMNCRDIQCPPLLMKDEVLYATKFFSSSNRSVSLTLYKAKRSKTVAR